MRKEKVGKQVKGQERKTHSDFPGGTMVKNPLVNAGDTGSTPGLGRVRMPQSTKAHMPQPPQHGQLEPVLGNKRSHHSEERDSRN